MVPSKAVNNLNNFSIIILIHILRFMQSVFSIYLGLLLFPILWEKYNFSLHFLLKRKEKLYKAIDADSLKMLNDKENAVTLE